MSTLDDFLMALSKRARGRMLLSNLYHDGYEARLSVDVLRRLFAVALPMWKKHASGRLPENIIADAVGATPGEYQCQGRPSLTAEACSRVVLAKDFVREHVAHHRLGWIEEPDHLDDARVRRLERGFPIQTSTTIPRERSLAWVTKTAEVDAIRGSSRAHELANELRNGLGLLHFLGEEVQFIELRYPVDSIPDGLLIPPTFLDSRPNLIYRSVKRTDGWGCAVHLTGLAEGLPEAVHPKIPFDGRFAVRAVGWTTGATLDLPSFDRLVETAPYPWRASHHAAIATWINGTSRRRPRAAPKRKAARGPVAKRASRVARASALRRPDRSARPSR